MMSIPILAVTTLCVLIFILVILRLTIFRSLRNRAGSGTGSCMTIGGREVQEDAFEIATTKAGLLAVLADGMGEAYGGRIAGRLAVDAFKDLFEEYTELDNPQYYFRRAFQAANRAILRELEEERRGSASVGAALIQGSFLYYAVVGNVKLAVFRDGDLVPVSEGQTVDVLAQKGFREGSISRQDALALLSNHRLYNYVGQDGFRDMELFDKPIALRAGDVLVLMSDGVWDFLPWRELEDTLSSGGGCQTMAFQIIEKINRMTAADKDNASIVLIRF